VRVFSTVTYRKDKPCLRDQGLKGRRWFYVSAGPVHLEIISSLLRSVTMLLARPDPEKRTLLRTSYGSRSYALGLSPRAQEGAYTSIPTATLPLGGHVWCIVSTAQNRMPPAAALTLLGPCTFSSLRLDGYLKGPYGRSTYQTRLRYHVYCPS
jgi:hypothetical protein